jgi:competence protein ComEC
LDEVRPAVRLRARRLIADWVGVTLVAQIAAAPLLAQHFHTIPLTGMVANLLLAPVVAPIMWIALVLWPLGVIAPVVAAYAASVTITPMARFVIGVAHGCAAGPASALSVPSPGWPAVIGLYAAALMCLVLWHSRRTSTCPEALACAR